MVITKRSTTLRPVSSILLTCLFLLLESCGAGVNNSSEELSGDSYFRESGNDFNYITSHNELHKTIFSKIIAYAYNSNFVLAAQMPNYEYHRAGIAGELNHGKEDMEFLYKKADSILTSDPYYIKIFSEKVNFWIIRNKDHKLIGPLTSDEYLTKRRELKIPEELRLDVKL